MITLWEYVHTDELYHWGVKGMKWGKRRYQNKDGTLTSKGIKRYAKAGYTQDAYNSNKSVLGKARDKVTGAHKKQGNIMYKTSSAAANRARAEQYVVDKKRSDKKRSAKVKQISSRVIQKGAAAASNLLVKGALATSKNIQKGAAVVSRLLETSAARDVRDTTSKR